MARSRREERNEMCSPLCKGDTACDALRRLFDVARRDTGQARRVADFLLAWHNTEENRGWDPTDLWSVDDVIAEDMLTVLMLIWKSQRYPGDLGFRNEVEAVWRAWRGDSKDRST
jgi:hypothetical protein